MSKTMVDNEGRAVAAPLDGETKDTLDKVKEIAEESSVSESGTELKEDAADEAADEKEAAAPKKTAKVKETAAKEAAPKEAKEPKAA